MKYSEPGLNLDAKDSENFKDFDLMLFDKVIAFDNLKQKIILIVNMDEEYEQATKALQEMKKLIEKEQVPLQAKGKLKSEFRMLFDREKICEMLKRRKNIFMREIFFRWFSLIV